MMVMMRSKSPAKLTGGAIQQCSASTGTSMRLNYRPSNQATGHSLTENPAVVRGKGKHTLSTVTTDYRIYLPRIHTTRGNSSFTKSIEDCYLPHKLTSADRLLSTTQAYLCRHSVLRHLAAHYPVDLRVCEAPYHGVCRFRRNRRGRERGNNARDHVNTDGTNATARRGGVSGAQCRVGQATLVTLDQVVEVRGSSTVALINTFNRDGGGNM